MTKLPPESKCFWRTYQKHESVPKIAKTKYFGNFGANLPTYPRLCFIVRNASCLLVRFGTVGTCLKSTFWLLGQFGGLRTVSSKSSEIIDLSKMVMFPSKPKRAHRKWQRLRSKNENDLRIHRKWHRFHFKRNDIIELFQKYPCLQIYQTWGTVSKGTKTNCFSNYGAPLHTDPGLGSIAQKHVDFVSHGTVRCVGIFLSTLRLLGKFYDFATFRYITHRKNR